jgi:hypothetical protein
MKSAKIVAAVAAVVALGGLTTAQAGFENLVAVSSCNYAVGTTSSQSGAVVLANGSFASTSNPATTTNPAIGYAVCVGNMPITEMQGQSDRNPAGLDDGLRFEICQALRADAAVVADDLCSFGCLAR